MNTVFFGDATENLRVVADMGFRAQMCVTSPPYFGLRDYGHKGQIGLEETPEAFIAKLVEVFREVRRVLADDGTLWVNMGDSYACTGGSDRKASATASVGNTLRSRKSMPNRQQRAPAGVPDKNLLGIPWRLAFALQDDGWYLRQEIIWAKSNPMPESVTDRPTRSHEQIFLLSKQPRYFYDAEAVKEPVSGTAHPRGNGKTPKASLNSAGNKNNSSWDAAVTGLVERRNKRSVWTVATRPYAGAHFATFPPDLIRPCILAGSRPGDVVLDPFMGSGTTAAVALEHGRQYMGFELNPDYESLQNERIAKASK